MYNKFQEIIIFVIYNPLIVIFHRSSWTIPLAICCILFVFLLIAATIVLGLIPIYLSSPSVDIEIDTSESTLSIIISYSSFL